jgi:hypothetical protein
LISIKADIAEKKIEAQVFIDLVREACERPDSVIRASILKSAHMLLLYNIIESTTSAILERIHEIVAKEKYVDLREELRKLWCSYFFCKQTEKNRYSTLEKTIRGEAKFPQFFDFLKHINLFSGNLDGKALHMIMTKYGIGALTTSDRDKLIEIKNKRNKIAHGEEMFKEACRNFTINEMLSFQTACFNAVDNMVNQADDYVLLKRYRFSP